MDRFIKNNKVIIDNLTNLMWQDDNNIHNRINWYDANTNGIKCNLGGFTDWRLPSVDELLSIANKNDAPNLNAIFENRQFITWSSFEDYENNMFIYGVFYSDNIVPLIHLDIFHKTEELFIRYVRDNNVVYNDNYNTDIYNLTCTCKNWKLLRSKFEINDPRRLCKHLMKKLDINTIQGELNRYKLDIKFYKDKNKGFYDDFNEIMDITNTSYKLFYKYAYDWMSIYSQNGEKYGVLTNEYNNNIIWAKQYGKPEKYYEIENFLLNLPKIICIKEEDSEY